MKFIPVVTFLIGLFLYSCSDAPTTIGGDYIPTNVEFKSYILKSSEFEINSKIAEASNSSAEFSQEMLVGSSNDGSIAHGLFYLIDSLFIPKGSRAENKPISDVVLRLRPTGYRYGDTTIREGSFDVIEIPQSFAGNVKWNDTVISKIQSATSLGTFTGKFTDTTFINIPLDRVLITQFLSSYLKDGKIQKMLGLRSKVDSRSIVGIWGSSGNAGVIADSLKPQLKVSYGDTTLTLLASASNWISKSLVNTGIGKIAFAGGESIRTLIKFNLDSIPKNAVIHKAELTLTVDTTSSKFGTFKLSRYLVGYSTSDSTKDNLKSGSIVATSRRGAKDSISYLNTFSFPVLGPIISDWLLFSRGTGNQKNNGIIFALNRSLRFDQPLEVNSVDKLIFYGNDAQDTTKRPRLAITYSINTSK